jgi:hypothetical protein
LGITLKVESVGEFDAAKTSELACRAFGKSGAELSLERFKWTVEDGYDQVIVASAFADGEKIGQAAAILKRFSCNGNVERVAELVDLFVSPDHRDFATVSAIYRKLKAALEAEQITRIYTYPNPGARLLNRRFFGLNQFEVLPIQLGLSTGIAWGRGASDISVLNEIDEMVAEYDRIAGRQSGDGLFWGKEPFRRRISSPVHRYLMASDDTFALLASPRRIRGVKVLLISAIFQRESQSPGSGRTRALLSKLCAATGMRLFLYAGWNRQAAFRPGLAVPRFLQGNVFSLQSNFLVSHKDEVPKVELIDLDYG